MKVLIVDDEPMIIEVLQAYLEKAGYAVISAANGYDALYLCKEEKPDFIVLDLMLPDLSGEEVCKRIREYSNVPIMMLTAKTAEEERIHGIVIGADDYVVKPFSPREVMVRIEAILRRTRKEVQGDLYSFNNGQLNINHVSHEVKVRDQIVSLTPIEYKLLVGMAKYPSRVYSRLDLLEKVQNESYEGYERSIDVHIKNLRKKIEVNSKEPEYILTVFGIGYKFGGKRDVSDSSI
ncbi:response regulator transcription factor [Anaerobacillus sp. MEB173]|uniref:response regulator transcription factor n=1 Tax=Anaerobacillus sp. MEB173 TaxID=3383345 RepID=UPI003F8E49B3